MWEPWHLTTPWTPTACYRDSFTFYLYYKYVCTNYHYVSQTILRPWKELLWIRKSESSSRWYASPSSILPYIPLQSSNHLFIMNVGSEVATFTSHKPFELVNVGEREQEGNIIVGRDRKSQMLSSLPSTRLLLISSYSTSTKHYLKRCLVRWYLRVM
jgi:hypothetical protein